MADTSTRDTDKKAAAMNTAQLKEQRDFMRDMELAAGKLSIEYEKHSESLGSAVKDLTKMERLQAKIKTETSFTKSIELAVTELLKTEVKLKGDLKTKASEMLDLEKKIIAEKAIGDTIAAASGEAAAKTSRDREASFTAQFDTAKSLTTELQKQRLLNDIAIRGENRTYEAQKKKTEQLIKQEHRQKSINTTTEKFFGNTLKNLQASDFSKGFGLDKFIGKMAGSVTVAISATIALVSKMFDVFLKFDSEMVSLRKHFGIFREDSKNIEDMAKSTALNYAKLGVTIDMSSNAIKSIGDNFGLISTFTQDVIDNVSILNASLGISEKTSADMLHTLAGISEKSLKDASTGMIGFTEQLSKAAGTNLNQVMSDIATASDSVRSTFRGSTLELIKTTVEARRMGLSLESMAKTSEGLLDFNSSVNAEMEASVLLGKNLNLNEARRKAWNGDILGANKEILKVVKSAGDFDKMNIFQKKALAAAVGKSVEEIQKMLQREKEIKAIKASGRQDLIEQLKKEEELMKLKEEQSKDIMFTAEQGLKERSNQTRMNELQQRWNQLILDVGQPLLENVIEPMMSMAVVILPKIIKFMQENSGLMKILGIAALGVAAACGVVAAKALLIGGAITSVIMLGYSLGKKLSEPFEYFFEWIVEKWYGLWEGDLVGGIVSIQKDLMAAIMLPFDLAWEGIKKWMGFSPSELGTGIVRGILSIGTQLISALTTPFTSAFNFITELFGRIPEFITKVFKRGFDFVTKLPGMGLLTKAIDTFSGNKTADVNQKVETVQTKQDDTNRLILEKLTELTNLMKSGGIAINMDGRRVSEALAHASSR